MRVTCNQTQQTSPSVVNTDQPFFFSIYPSSGPNSSNLRPSYARSWSTDPPHPTSPKLCVSRAAAPPESKPPPPPPPPAARLPACPVRCSSAALQTYPAVRSCLRSSFLSSLFFPLLVGGRGCQISIPPPRRRAGGRRSGNPPLHLLQVRECTPSRLAAALFRSNVAVIC